MTEFAARVMRALVCACAMVAATPYTAHAAQPIPEVTQRLIDLIRTDEAEFVAAAKAGDSVRLERLKWRNRQAAFDIVKQDPPADGDAAAQAVRKAHVACANAHSSLGMLTNVAAQLVLDNAGGDNSEVDNESVRRSLAFFLKPFHDQRTACAALTKTDLGPTPVATSVDALLAPFKRLSPGHFTPEERTLLVGAFAAAETLEKTLADPATRKDRARLEALFEPLHAFSATLKRHDDSGAPRAAASIVRECKWMAGDLRSLLSQAMEHVVRPDLAPDNEAAKILRQYRQQTKPDCAQALGLPKAKADVAIPRGALGDETAQ